MSRFRSPQKEHLQYYKTFSINLKYYRFRLELTQKQVAQRAGVSAKYVSLLERSTLEHVPSLETLFCLSDALEIEPHRLFKALQK